MRSVTWPTRIAALLQLLLLLPPLASGSVCISRDGAGRLEPGFCACMSLPRSASEAAIAPTGTEECGPCRDEMFSALRNPVPSAPRMMMTASALVTPRASAVADPVTGPRAVRAGEPPGTRLPILRC
jgi:hypothetical protein